MAQTTWPLPVYANAAPKRSAIASLMDCLLPQAEERMDEQPRIPALVFTLAGALVLVLLSVAGARRVNEVREHWQSDWRVRQAEQYFADGDYPSGFAKANAAYLDCPQNEDAIRCLARHCSEAGAAEALFFFDRLERMNRINNEDLVSKVSALIHRGCWKEAQVLAHDLLQAGNDSDQLLTLGCTLDNEGYTMPAGFHQRALRRLSNFKDTRSALSLARVLMKSESPDLRSEAASFLWKLAESGDRFAARQAARALHQHLHGTDPRSKYLAWLMTELPGADAPMRVDALSRLTGIAPEKADDLLGEAVYAWKAESLDDRVVLGRLLLGCAKPRLLTGLFSRSEGAAGPHVAELYVAGLMSTGRFKDCVSLVNDRELPVSRAQRSYAESVVAIRSHCSMDEARRHLLCTFGAASAEANPALLSGVAELAAGCGLASVAEQAYEECLTIHGSESVAFEGLIALFDARGDTEKIRITAGRALAMWPGHERYQEIGVYVNLLLGIDIERSLLVAERLLSARPEDDMRLFLVTMANARLGNTTGVREHLRRLHYKGGIPMRYLAVIGGLLKGSGDSETAGKAVAGIHDADVTLPEEKAFLALARL